MNPQNEYLSVDNVQASLFSAALVLLFLTLEASQIRTGLSWVV